MWWKAVITICTLLVGHLSYGHVVKEIELDDTQKYDTHLEDVGETDDWWKTAVFYQIYPRSFMDSDGDGVGDLGGAKKKLQYLKDIGITGAWLSPIFESPGIDQGYDISNYRKVDDVFGGNTALLELLKEAKKIGLKIILDFVPNHTSDQHEWFQKSLKNDKNYRDFYVWHDGKVVNGIREAPNNWISTFKGSAWEWSEERKQYYFHQFAKQQPDLNYRNPKVLDAMKEVLTFWLDAGVDGFRVDAVPYIMEDAELRDEPIAEGCHYDQSNADCLQRIYTKDTNGTYEVVYALRDHVDEYAKAHKNTTKVLMSEAYTGVEETMRYQGSEDGTRKGAHFTFNFNLLTMLKPNNFNVTDIKNAIDSWMQNMPKIYTPNWVLGNHDNHRFANRLGRENLDGFNMLTAFLPGIMVTYNGDEIGMENGEVTCEQSQDTVAKKDCSTFNQTSRDFERTPFQWDDTKNAGFSTANETWLPVAKNYKQINVKVESKSDMSHLSIYKNVVRLRSNFATPSKSDNLTVSEVADGVLFVGRQRDEGTYSLLFNIADEDKEITFPSKMELMMASKPGDKKVGDVMSSMKLSAHECVILKGNSDKSSADKVVASLLVIALYSILHVVI